MRWTPNLAVGIELIDEQHKIWFQKAENLFEAGKNRQAKEYIGEMLDFLEDYTKSHFADEERYMLNINYPGYNEQRKAHQSFIEQLAKLRSDFEQSQGSISVIMNANKMVLDWLTGHISRLDKKIGEFVRSQKD